MPIKCKRGKRRYRAKKISGGRYIINACRARTMARRRALRSVRTDDEMQTADADAK